MALEIHRDRHIVCKPKHQRATGAWIPSAIVTWWEDDGFHSKYFSEVTEKFDSEQEATEFGLALARAWIEDND
jgi:hypothetical protein